MPKRHDNEKIEREKRKDAYIKKVCHMPTRHVKEKKERKKEKKYSPHPRKIKKREMVHEKEFIHHSPKNNIYQTTHLHILIKVYDLFLFGSSL